MTASPEAIKTLKHAYVVISEQFAYIHFFSISIQGKGRIHHLRRRLCLSPLLEYLFSGPNFPFLNFNRGHFLQLLISGYRVSIDTEVTIQRALLENNKLLFGEL